MELYLVRHGEAESAEHDPARPLSERGRREVDGAARAAAARGLSLELICHSGKLRARQTAEIMAQHLEPRKGLSPLPGLNPNDGPEAARRLAEQAGEATMLVGHLPHLSRLASLLLMGDAEPQIVLFEPATLAALLRTPQGWLLRWLHSPRPDSAPSS